MWVTKRSSAWDWNISWRTGETDEEVSQDITPLARKRLERIKSHRPTPFLSHTNGVVCPPEDLAAVGRLIVIHTHQLQGIQTFTSSRQNVYITAVYCFKSHSNVHLQIRDSLFPLSVSTVEQQWEKSCLICFVAEATLDPTARPKRTQFFFFFFSFTNPLRCLDALGRWTCFCLSVPTVDSTQR